jgi:hypothetical protein
MNKFIFSLLIFLLILATSAFSQLQPFGLQGKNITTLAYIPNAIDPYRTLLAAGTDSEGVFFYEFASPNPDWFNFGLTGKEITALNIQHIGIGPAELNAIYAAVVPDFAAGDSVILYQQNPLINTPWIPADSGLAFSSGDNIRAIGSLHFYGHTPPRPVFIGLNSKIFKSGFWIDWQTAWSPSGYVILNAIQTCQNNFSDVVWATGETGFLQPLFLKSVDDGSTWTEFYPNLGGDNGGYAISINPLNPDEVYVAMEKMVAKTIDGGQNWASTGLQNPDVVFLGIVIDPGNPAHLLAGGDRNGNNFALYETYNSATDWTEIQPASPLSGITAIAADTLNGEFVAYVATRGDGIYRYLSQITGIKEKPEAGVPLRFMLIGNYPNPFNASTTILYGLSESALVSLEIFALNGQKIKTLINQRQDPGNHTVRWNTADVASGIYLLAPLIDGKRQTVCKMILVR